MDNWLIDEDGDLYYEDHRGTEWIARQEYNNESLEEVAAWLSENHPEFSDKDWVTFRYLSYDSCRVELNKILPPELQLTEKWPEGGDSSPCEHCGCTCGGR